jgi:hypothetical protein
MSTFATITRDVKLGRGHQSCRSETQGKLGWKISQSLIVFIAKLELDSESLRRVPFSPNPELTGFPDSLLTVLVITRLSTSQTGPLHRATLTVGFRAKFRAHNRDLPVNAAAEPEALNRH